MDSSHLLKLFAALLIGHALCDFPWQGQFLSDAKNRFNPIPGVPWFWCLGWHAAINGGMVWAVTGHAYFGLTEFVFHFLIDDTTCAMRQRLAVLTPATAQKSASRLFNLDQIAHVACKAAWILLLWWGTR